MLHTTYKVILILLTLFFTLTYSSGSYAHIIADGENFSIFHDFIHALTHPMHLWLVLTIAIIFTFIRFIGSKVV